MEIILAHKNFLFYRYFAHPLLDAATIDLMHPIT
jgi:hypothetical protein